MFPSAPFDAGPRRPRLELAAAFVATFLAQGAVLRWLLARAILASGLSEMVRRLGSDPSPARIALDIGRDLPFALAGGALLALAPPWRRAAAAARPPLAGVVLGAALLLAGGAAAGAHLRLYAETHSPLDLEAVSEALAGTPADFLDYVTGDDLLLLATPLAFLALLAAAARAGRGLRRSAGLALALALPVLGLALPAPKRAVDPRVRLHPLPRLVQLALARRDLGLDALPPLAAGQQASLAWRDPLFVAERPAPAAESVSPAALTAEPRSVLLVVLESTSFTDTLREPAAAPDAMPYLRELAAGGWSLAEHRTTGNSTARALFSILSGLYPPPDGTMFVTAPRLALAALPGFLPGRERFVVTPVHTRGLFPRSLLERNGVAEITDYDRIPETRPGMLSSRLERDGVDALVARLERTRGRPFFGFYLTYAPHQPYFEQEPDPAARLVAAPRDDHERYRNALRVVDGELRRIVAALERSGHRDDTLLVLTGDHGEIFGAHGAVGHVRASWEEVLHVPAVLWAPGWLAPRVETRPSSHVDLAPTILDALGVSFDPAVFQGESLFRPLARRFVFAYGGEGSVAALRRDGLKVLWDTHDGRCVAFDLHRDPAEAAPLDCGRFAAARAAAMQFRRFQPRQLRRFDLAMRRPDDASALPAPLALLPRAGGRG